MDNAKKNNTLKDIRAFILVDMIGDRDLQIKKESYSTPWLTDVIWAAAARLKRPEFLPASTPIEDDHLPFLEAGIPSVGLIDFQYGPGPAPGAYWHTLDDNLGHVCAPSLDAVGEAALVALRRIR